MIEPTPHALLALIHDLDRGYDDHEETMFVEVTRWSHGSDHGGNRDDEATALIRQLLRERLGRFKLDEIGAAALAAVDGWTPPEE